MEDIKTKAHDDELNKADDRLEEETEDDRAIEREVRRSRVQRGVPSAKVISNVMKSKKQ